MCVRLVIGLVFLLSGFSYAYQIERTFRVINTSDSPITVDFDLCNYSSQQKRYTVCDHYQIWLSGISSSGHYYDIPGGYYDAPGNTLYQILIITRVSNNQVTTAFKASRTPLDSKRTTSTDVSCTLTDTTSTIVLHETDQRFYCQFF
ncbi:hypothetical protein [Legionella drozanskii]|uniref:Uncharacterized protein n=1 Tax=Legionella drozanskii LLAP-1 TaxID=1212489 RepID=A0A0W0ST46_9GAMM|nr:hypothetical protein [Legionella drozanskii]KTC86381.1 hypothetical protein Ldro_1848 [Legionella drozanskii LLAP-1]